MAWRLLLVFSLLSACSDPERAPSDADGNTSDADLSSAGADSSPDTGDAAPDVTLPDDIAPGWNIIEPGGETTCSRGSDFRFAVRTGTVNRVVIDFMGGGACWDEVTCSFADSIFNEHVDFLTEDFLNIAFSGIYDLRQEDNPFRDWYHVFIPYCTGDIHWGDQQTTYGEGTAAEVSIEHRGAVNTRAVMDWITERFSAPETLFVTGCSAGAYGSIGWAPHLIQAYPDARMVQMGDSGVGIITDSFFQDSFPSWNPWTAIPSWIPELDPDAVDFFSLELADLYGRVGRYYPGAIFSQYTTAFDDNQTFYFQAMGGGDQFEWSERMYAMLESAESEADNVYSFVAPGEQHCILGFDNFYTMEADGVRLVDWITTMVEGEPIESRYCTECDTPGR